MPTPLSTVDVSRESCSGSGASSAVMKESSEYRRQARVLKALANPARLHIIDRLSHGECSVGELTALVGLDQSTVSKHLAVLRGQAVVDDRRQGNRVFYRLLTPCVLDFFSCADSVCAQRIGRRG